MLFFRFFKFNVFLEKKSLATVSGNAFGAQGHVRFSYAVSDRNLSLAIDLVEESVHEFVNYELIQTAANYCELYYNNSKFTINALLPNFCAIL